MGEHANDKIENPVLHVLVVGFHHKKGCQVEYAFPPLIPGSTDEDGCGSECPPGWKYLPTLALPDGSHNYDQDTVFFHLPSLTDPDKSVFGISCFRQIPVEKLKNRTADITRGTVQKSVCVLSSVPLYGHIEVKMSLITHAYFDEGDFTKVSLLRDTYHHLNACLNQIEDLQNAPQLFVGLSGRDLILQWRHKTLLLFKLLLLERKVVFYRSPVQPLCSTLLSLLSLHPGMIETGLYQSACVQPSRPMSPVPQFAQTAPNRDTNTTTTSTSTSNSITTTTTTTTTLEEAIMEPITITVKNEFIINGENIISSNKIDETAPTILLQHSKEADDAENEKNMKDAEPIIVGDIVKLTEDAENEKRAKDAKTPVIERLSESGDEGKEKTDDMKGEKDSADATDNPAAGNGNDAATQKSGYENNVTVTVTLPNKLADRSKRNGYIDLTVTSCNGDGVCPEFVGEAPKAPVARPVAETGGIVEIGHEVTCDIVVEYNARRHNGDADDLERDQVLISNLPRDISVETLGDATVQNNMALIAQVNSQMCGVPLPIFTQGYLCMPYLSLPYMDLLTDKNVRGYVVGATNVLFKQKKRLADVLVEVEGTKIETSDMELRRLLHLTTEDLRFADYLVRHVAEERHDVFLDGVGWEGGDEWIRAQFRVYLLCLLRTSLLKEGSRELDHFNAAFVSAWRQTASYNAWLQNTNARDGIWEVNPGHPFAGQLSVADMKLRLSHTMQNTEGGRKLNQAMVNTGKAVVTTGRAVGGVISHAKGALTNWWSNLTTAQSPTDNETPPEIGEPQQVQQIQHQSRVEVDITIPPNVSSILEI